MKRSKFYQFFPPPHFLQMPVVGLDISDVTVRFAELVETNKGLIIGRFGEQNIPRGVIESGEVKKPAELRAVLSVLKKEHGLEFVSMSLPEERAYLFDLHLPVIKYSEIRGAIELVLEEHVPLKATEVLFDYDIYKETETAIQIRVSVIPRAVIDGYLEAFLDTGITPTALEIETQSVARSVIPENDAHTAMVVDFGRMRTGISIVSEGVVVFTSTVPVGGGALTAAISKYLTISLEEAEKVKRKKGIFGGDNNNEELSLVLVSAISILRDELHRHYAYWQTHDDDYGKKRLSIEKIYLCGGDSNLVGFVEYLAAGLEVPVVLSNVMVNVNPLDLYVPEINFSDSLRYATAIGLALRHRQ